MDKEKIVLQAVESLKKCPFKATAIKVELEADLSRRSSEYECLELLLTNVQRQLGLEENDIAIEDDNYERHADAYKPLPGVVFARFYNDGSVDSELTFTISLSDPKNILMLPMFIEAWNELADGEGGQDTSGAGMHMALINSTDCSYPCNMSATNTNRFSNFARSMQLLLPSLYFLASHNDTSRALEYRLPRIRQCRDRHGYSKFNAISYNSGALEFRVFETCYDKPEAIFDNVVVMANSMKFWRQRYVSPGLENITRENITREINFGNDYDGTLLRFYSSNTHLDLLDRGLAVLKPAYYTIEELKEEREFDVSKDSLEEKAKDQVTQAEHDYEEYIERVNWHKSSLLKEYRDSFPTKAALESYVTRSVGTIEPKTKYIADRLSQIKDDLAGHYTLAAS